MKKAVQIIIFLLISAHSEVALAQGASGEPQASDTVQEQQAPKKVTAVYGVTADDYLPEDEFSAQDYLKPQTRRAPSRPGFDLPDAFYFIGGPVFLLILLRVLVIFLNGFEEKRKEEENEVASEHFNPE
ncbi:hypothetical protein P4B35_14745 [Pontiellaceae bacterium B12227]|nr:hypothetical protein [Pontiellaceae bacterium B12227]